MSLNKSIVEDSALEWFKEPGYAIGFGPRVMLGDLTNDWWRAVA